MKKWKIISKIKNTNQIVKILLENRGLKTKVDINEFLHPRLEDITVANVGIDKKQLKKAVERIKKAIKNQEQIIVYGDYDVDGICGTAILWETLNSLGAKVLPYIPHRIEEGYGLSLAGISNLKSQISNLKLIITVDNGIVANAAVDFANKNGIDVIITDHHVPSKKLPKAHAIVHTTKLCGAGVAWALAQKLKIKNEKLKIEDNHLELVALATIADLVPLLGANRTLTKYGLEALRKTKRVGLLELFREAGIDALNVDTYQVGHVIAPRLNAAGRITHAMDSLRLLCTKNREKAKELAQKLGTTNKERQQITEEALLHAKTAVTLRLRSEQGSQKLLFTSHESYQQGVIGLVAGKLVDEFYRPAIVVAKGDKYSKASARSVSGFNMIEFIRTASELLVDVGGHPMAAGFTVETEKLLLLQEKLEESAEKAVGEDLLARTLRIDCEIKLSDIIPDFYEQLQTLEPFGMGNPQPTFVSRGVTIEDMRLVGADSRHLKFRLSCHPERSEGSQDSSPASRRAQNDILMDAIAFGLGERAGEFHIGDKVDIVYIIEQDTWNGNQKLQLKIKDIQR